MLRKSVEGAGPDDRGGILGKGTLGKLPFTLTVEISEMTECCHLWILGSFSVSFLKSMLKFWQKIDIFWKIGKSFVYLLLKLKVYIMKIMRIEIDYLFSMQWKF